MSGIMRSTADDVLESVDQLAVLLDLLLVTVIGVLRSRRRPAPAPVEIPVFELTIRAQMKVATIRIIACERRKTIATSIDLCSRGIEPRGAHCLVNKAALNRLDEGSHGRDGLLMTCIELKTRRELLKLGKGEAATSSDRAQLV